MRLERLIMRNWCKVQYREVDFHPGMNALLGPNGSGKSNTMNAIVFALTGDYSRNAGTKEENIHQLNPKGPADVRLIFTHNQQRFDVTRALIGSTTTLDVADLNGTVVEKVRGEKKVTARLTELLHVNAEILTGYVFVGQGKMFEPFDTTITPAARLVAFMQLFGLDRLEQLWEAIGEALSALPVIVAPDPQPYMDELAAVRVQMQTASQVLAGLVDIKDWQLDTDPDNELVNRARTALALGPTLTQNESTHRSATAAWWQTRRALWQARDQQRLFQLGLNELNGGPYARSQEILRAASEQQMIEQEILQARRALDEANLALNSVTASAPLPPATDDDQTVDVLNTRISTIQQELAVDRDQLIRMGDGTVCPTCGQPIQESIVALREQTQRRIATNDSSLQVLVGLRNTRQQYEQQVTRHQQELTRSRDRMEIAQQRHDQALRRQITTSVSAQEVLAARKTQEDYASVTRALDMCAGSIGPLTANFTNQRTLVRTARKAIRDLRRQIAEAPTKDAADQAYLRLQQKMNRSREYSSARTNYEAHVTRHAQAELALSRVEELRTSAAQGQALRTRLQILRDILHRENLPKALLQQRLASCGENTNSALELFLAPFRLEPREDRLSYRATFADGCVQPIERLSGGEKVITAFAFRIAVNARFASELGLLCLDEPTVYLDSDNVRCLEPALIRLRQHAQATGLQCVIITHEDVGHLFDHVITCP